MTSDKQKHNDISLFRQAVSDVTPLTQENSVHHDSRPFRKKHTLQPASPKQPPATSPFSDLMEPDLVGNEEVLEFRRSGIQKRLFSRLKSGQIPVEAELDMHGMTIQHAHDALAEFLHQCRLSQLRCVRIIHGKGWRSKDHRPVLKTKVNTWLRQDNTILAFCSATLQDGGTGAVYVLLKRNKKPDNN